jgi:hypothetical protein
MIDLATYEPRGDKQNSSFFEDNLPRVYERRSQSGLSQLVGAMAAVVIQVDHGNGLAYMAELSLMGPYRFRECWLNQSHRIHLLEADPRWPRLILLEPLSRGFEDEATRWNRMYPLAAAKPNARYIGEIYSISTRRDLRSVLEPQNIRFVYPDEASVDVPLDSLAALDLGDRVLLDDESLELLEAAGQKHQRHGLAGRVLGIDHLATRVLAGEREDALLEYLTMVPYYFWGAYNIAEMNSSTNVTRHPSIGDEKQSPARVFTANNTPSYLNSFDNLPMPTEDFVRNYGRRMHHIAYEVVDGDIQGEKNVDFVVDVLRDLGIPFLADVVGECTEQPNLKQIFSKASPYSLLITEYVERCLGYDGFFTRDNVAALTAAAGEAERYEHGHVFD